MNVFESEICRQLDAFTPKTLFLAAVSGGADSTAMLSALAAIRKEKPFILRCLHVEHGIRPEAESRGDAEAVKRLCKSLEVPCKVVFIPPGKISGTSSQFNVGIEAAARLYRYRLLEGELCRLRRRGRRDCSLDAILTAHTRDDLLETMLMRFLRGSGPSGLASMSRESFALEQGRILRPLLGLTRTGVISYLEEKGLSCCSDSTNDDPRYLRNRIRHKLIPLLDASFPFWRNALLFSGETQKLTAEFLSSEAEKRLRWEESGGTLRIPLEAFFKEALILREEAFFQAVDRIGDRGSGTGDRGSGIGDRGSGTGDRGPGTGDRGSGIRDRGSGIGDQGSGTGDWGSGTGDRGLGIGDQGPGTGDRGSGIGDRGSGTGDRGRKILFRKPPRRSSVRRFLEDAQNSARTGERVSSDSVCKAHPPINSTIRKDSSGGGSAGDLGPVRAEKKSGYLFLKPALQQETSSGFSLLIKECGSYSLECGFSVKISGHDKAGSIREPCFIARLPLVFRYEKGLLAAGQNGRFSDMLKNNKSYAGEIIIAEDGPGIAALIGKDNGRPFLLYRREEGGCGSPYPEEQACLIGLRGSDV